MYMHRSRRWDHRRARERALYTRRRRATERDDRQVAFDALLEQQRQRVDDGHVHIVVVQLERWQRDARRL